MQQPTASYYQQQHRSIAAFPCGRDPADHDVLLPRYSRQAYSITPQEAVFGQTWPGRLRIVRLLSAKAAQKTLGHRSYSRWLLRPGWRTEKT